ncbi:S8 family serine peptidase [Knoellia locipacati]|uniref:Serine protease n=1 Tax=Knoellia locipacati TaxID=882824 RepID=A0A512SZS7_9MICO|nr:S8 family serine peptidase [Knoellia locipacati]GEQ13477.1 serine protease [Knoellia locipacati]
MTRRTMRRTFTTVTGIAAAALAVTAAAPPSGAAPRDREITVAKTPKAEPQNGKVKPTKSADKLGRHDRDLLEKAVDSKAARVVVMIATSKGKTADAVKAIRASGGVVATVNDKLGYISASVPTGKVDAVAKNAAILAVDLNESIPLPKPEAQKAGGGKAAATAAPGASTPDDNPFMPTRDTGSIAFKKANPTFDGRGVTIGVIDSGVDLDHPALQKTSTGERKIVDWVTGTDPLLENDASWRPMLTSVTGPTFTIAGVGTYTAPAGTYKFNRVAESISLNDEAAGDFNRDGDTTDRWGILYDEKTNDIWVDANQDFVFSPDEKMRPYKEKFDIGHFGVDNPATPIAESMPFVVEYREDVDLTPAGLPGQKADFVNIGVVEAAHGTHVAGIAAGHSLLGGAMNGQAPGAKIVSSRACSWGGGCTAVALTDGMVDLVVNRGVQIVNMSIGGLPALNDGNNARARLYDALISTYGVQIVISAGNSGPGINSIGDPSVATDVISVASSITKETWKSNYGADVSSKLALHNYSSRGPREDGGFKPNIMAPGSAISSIPTWQPGGPVPEAGYDLPPGYAHFNGTSMASPQAAGAGALLLSAAKAQGVSVTPRQLRDSIYSSANYQRDLEAIGQGAGLMDVPAAWRLLRTEPTSQDYTVVAPVCTPISSLLATPDKGTGLYNRCAADAGGLRSGVEQSYPLTVTRDSGKDGNVQHQLRLVGNDGTFSLASKQVKLGLDSASTVSVRAKTSKPGVHSAILEIDDPRTSVVDKRVLLTVVLSQDLASPKFSQVQSDTVERNLNKKLFVTVPAGAKSLQVNLGGIGSGSQVRWIAYNPYGVPVESTSSLVCFTNYNAGGGCNAFSRAYANPIPGIWELQVEARRTTPTLNNPYKLTASAQGVVVNPATQTLPTAKVGVASPVSWTVTNQFADVTIAPKGGPLGSAVAGRKTVANHEVQSYTVTIPAGATKFTAKIGNPSDLGADLDLFVRNAAGTIVAQQADGDSEEAVTMVNPAAGTYTVQVDAYSVPSGSTQYDYLDAFYSPGLGTLTVPSTTTALAQGASTSVTGAVTVAAVPEAGRQVSGEMQVLSDQGALLGTGQVLIGSVTP